MPTIIDELIVTLGLDTSGFSRGQKDSEAAQKGMRDDTTRTAKEIDGSGRKVAQSIGAIRDQVIGLFAAFTAGRGLTDFVADLTNSDAALGRVAKNIDMSTQDLAAWRNAADRAGGSADGITGSMQSLTQQFQQLALTNQSSVVPYFRAIGVQIADASGHIRPMSEILLDLSDRLSKLDPAKAQAIGRGLGIDQGTVNVLIQGRQAVTALLAESQKLGVANQADAESAQKRLAAFRGLGEASEDLGRKLLTVATPAILKITAALTRFAEWAAQHRPLIEAAFAGLTAAVLTFAGVLAAPLAGLAALSAGIAAAVTGIALLYDDWKVWTEGGKSAFSGFWQFFADKWASVSSIVLPVIASLKTYWSDLWQTAKDALVAFLSRFTGTSQQIHETWAKLFSDLSVDFHAFVDVIRGLGPLLLDAFKGAFHAAFAWIEDRFSAIKGAITGVFSKTPTSDNAGGSGSEAAPNAVAAILPKSRRDAAQADVDKLVSLGWSPAQAAGISANIQRESGGNASAVGDNGSAYGLGQWHPDRQANFAKWAGHDIRDSTRDEQLAFVDYELRHGSEKAAGTRLANATDAATAGDIVSRYYERPANAAGEAAARAALAQSLAPGPTPDAGLLSGAGVAAASAITTNNASNSNSSSSNVQIGEININAPNAKNSDDIAKSIGGSVQQYSFVAQANYGLTG